MDASIEAPAAGTDTVPASPIGGSSAAGSSAGRRHVDPLRLLRDYISQKKKVLFQDDWLDFDGQKIHRSAKCGYVLQKGGTLLDIGSIWYMFHNTSADRQYTQGSTRESNFEYIGIDRRGDLCDFLLGRKEWCLGLVLEVLEGRKRPRESAPRPVLQEAEDTTLADALSYEDCTKRVRSVQDLDVVIRRPGRLVPNANMILKIAQEEWQALATGQKKVAPVSKSAKGQVPLHVELEDMLRKSQNNKPIVLVPCSKNAPVNLLNVQELLQNGTYTRPDEERLSFFESTRAESVEVKRNIGGKLWTFEVRDSVSNFTKEQWYRTVLVITDGMEWQFKNWPFSTVVDLFYTIRGVYFQDPHKPVLAHIKEWPCKKVTLPALEHQHRFSNLRDEIFTDLEDFMNRVRPKKWVNGRGYQGSSRNTMSSKTVPIGYSRNFEYVKNVL